jgi:hypothetical protein
MDRLLLIPARLPGRFLPQTDRSRHRAAGDARWLDPTTEAERRAPEGLALLLRKRD